MRAVLDTNVLLSGLLWHGAPHDLIAHIAAGRMTLISSPYLLAEFARVIGRSKFDTVLVRISSSRERVLAELRRLAEIVDSPPLPHPVCRDPDDDTVLALAIAAKADLIISGDDDLLSLKHYQRIAIVTPAEALQRVDGI